jgi:membrane protein implicated in regulation of membrane protease activity
MPWWGWIVVGAALLGAETIVDAQFYLVFFGVAALLTGALGAAGMAGPVWMQWAIFGVLCVAGAAFRPPR